MKFLGGFSRAIARAPLALVKRARGKKPPDEANKELGLLQIDWETLDAKQRLQLSEKSRWHERVRVDGADLRIVVRSKTELARARKLKETWSVEWLRRLPQDSVLWDVGANVGVLTLIAASRPEVSRIVAIEPFFLNYSSLMENVVLNGFTDKVIAVAGGLGDHTGFIQLKLENLTPGGALHSFGDIAKLNDVRDGKAVGGQMCACYRMDDLVKISGIPFPTHLKIDIDGFELSLLEGAKQTLSDPRMRGIQIETMDHDSDFPQRAAVTEIIEGVGYTLKNAIRHGSEDMTVFDLQFERK